MSATRRHPAGPAAGTARSRGGPAILIAVTLAAGGGVLAASGSGQGRAILAAVQRFMLTYSGVFALIALTAAVAAGLTATDRLIMTPGGRVVSQAVHRALSLAAAGLLVTHVLLETLAHRSRPVDAVVPFLAGGRTLYLGLGTLASDLLLLILVTGVARRRFAAGWPGAWRAVHVTAYLAWPLAIVHGLLAGRRAQPYVDWSYGACLAVVALALLIRLAATPRSRAQAVSPPVPGPGRVPGWAPVAYQGRYGPLPGRTAARPLPPAQPRRTRRVAKP